VAEFGELGDCGARAVVVGADHAVGGEPDRRPVDEDDRQAALPFGAQVRVVAGRGRHHQQPGDLPVEERVDERAFPFRILLRGAHDQREPVVTDGAFHAGRDRAEERVADVRDDERERPVPAARAHVPGQRVGPESEGFDDFEHPTPGLGADARLVVEGPGDGLDADARLPGHVLESRPLDLPAHR
jgi:hypothetical protein